jgi:hypothetical protein
MLKFLVINKNDLRFKKSLNNDNQTITKTIFYQKSIITMKRLIFFVPVFLFLASCVKENETPKPQKALITDIKVNKFPTTDGGKAWDANALNTSDTAPDMTFEITNTDAAKVILKNRSTTKYWGNATLTNLPTWTLNPKFELATLSDKINIDFYDDDDSLFDSNDDFMATCVLDMSKETINGSSFPKTITIDNGGGTSITLTIEYVY